MTPLDSIRPSNQSEPLAAQASLTKLQRENEELRRQLTDVLHTATNNERIWRHFAEIEHILFRTRELDQLAEELLREIKARFHPEQACLLLCHADLVEHFFPDAVEESLSSGDGTWIAPFPMDLGSALWGRSSRPVVLSSKMLKEVRPFLPAAEVALRSAVVIPLCIHQIFYGGLFLGSTDAHHYDPQAGTDLLEQLGIKVALCLENCLTYERMKSFAVEDTVTGLLNFFQIHAILEREFRRSSRLGRPLSVLLIDLDFVHAIEDHPQVGKAILKHTADLLMSILPEEESFTGRYGSDEFLVVLPGVAEEEAREVVPYLTQRVRKAPFRYQNTAILIQTLMGVGTWEEDMNRPQALLDRAYTELCRLKMSRNIHASR